jgi:hypothetical protein
MCDTIFEYHPSFRTLWNAQLFPVTTVPNSNNRKEKRNKNEDYLFLFLLQYLKSYAEKEVSNEIENDIPLAIIDWKRKKKLSLYDLLSYGDARKMHNWRQYLHNIQERTPSPSPVISEPTSKMGSSHLLNGICVSRCDIGGCVSRAPSSYEVAARIDGVYERCFEAIRNVCHVLVDRDRSISEGTFMHFC